MAPTSTAGVAVEPALVMNGAMNGSMNSVARERGPDVPNTGPVPVRLHFHAPPQMQVGQYPMAPPSSGENRNGITQQPASSFNPQTAYPHHHEVHPGSRAVPGTLPSHSPLQNHAGPYTVGNRNMFTQHQPSSLNHQPAYLHRHGVHPSPGAIPDALRFHGSPHNPQVYYQLAPPNIENSNSSTPQRPSLSNNPPAYPYHHGVHPDQRAVPGALPSHAPPQTYVVPYQMAPSNSIANVKGITLRQPSLFNNQPIYPYHNGAHPNPEAVPVALGLHEQPQTHRRYYPMAPPNSVGNRNGATQRQPPSLSNQPLYPYLHGAQTYDGHQNASALQPNRGSSLAIPRSPTPSGHFNGLLPVSPPLSRHSEQNDIAVEEHFRHGQVYFKRSRPVIVVKNCLVRPDHDAFMGAQANTRGLNPTNPLGRSGTGVPSNKGKQGGSRVVTAQHTIREDLPSTYAVYTAASGTEAKDLDPNFNTFDDILEEDMIRIAGILDQLDNIPPSDPLQACRPHPKTGEPGHPIEMGFLRRVARNGGQRLEGFRMLIAKMDLLRSGYFGAWDHFLALSRSLVDLTAELSQIKEDFGKLPENPTVQSLDQHRYLSLRLNQNQTEVMHTDTRFRKSKDHVIKCSEALVQEKTRALPSINNLLTTVNVRLRQLMANAPRAENAAARQRPTTPAAPSQVPDAKRLLDWDGDTADSAILKKQRLDNH